MKRFWVKVKRRNGNGWRKLKPAWATKVGGKLRWKTAKALQRKQQRASRKAKLRLVKTPAPKKTPKWSPTRDAVRKDASKWGLRHTSGDRSYNTLASVGRASDHWDEVDASWADDYYHPDVDKMHGFAHFVLNKYDLKQVLVHDAGSGMHVHVAGWAKGYR